jgi:membrane protein
MDQTSERYAAQAGRGRDAENPGEIPLSGWKDVLWRLYRSITRDRILLTAAGATFYILLALVPTLTAFVSIYGLFNDRTSVLDHVQLLYGIAPPGVLEVITDQLTRLTAQSADTLGLALLVSLSIALWSASAGIKAMFEAMNIAYQEVERRSFFVLNGIALLFTLGGAVATLLVITVVLVMPVLINFVPGGKGLEWTIRVAAYLAMLSVLACGLAALYRWGPSREEARWRWITPGALLSVVMLGAVSVGFSWYVANFTDNNATYGSLGAVIGLMTWLWISVTLVIIGAELNSEIEHQTARDSTTGPEQPMGERGAHMADTVGRVWPKAREEAERLPRDSGPKKRISLGALAFAIPAAAALHLARRNRRR